ncbi:hypothetical protein ACTOWA_20790 [Herbaspirillum seropedicae]|uniref:pPIWI_RE_Z domain-containing protein n=1 Tax=Herbaspirillum seropedicae TaxID=964 RepID=UPI003F8D4920
MTPQRLQELGLQRLDLLCAFMHHELGVNSLIHAPALLMGYQSVARSALLKGKRTALANLRRCCHGLGTLAALRAAASRYNDIALSSSRYTVCRFEINEKTLDFSPTFHLISEKLQAALEELHKPPQPRPHEFQLADTERPIHISIQHEGEAKRYAIDHLPLDLPKPTLHKSKKSRTTALQIRWTDLLMEAEQMDAIDMALKVSRPGNWVQRLRATSLKSPGKNGELLDESTITLEGLKHLIGLPGAGKTTLLVCLLRYLGLRGIKTAVFFPSIEVCRQYLEDLRRYDVRPGLLIGQGRDTKQKHALKLAESLATDDPLRGFGLTAPSADLFEGVCALPRLTTAPSDAFSVEDHFCRNIKQSSDKGLGGQKDRKFEDKLCPVWSLCSRNKAARELPNAAIWLGHIRSADTQVPLHSTPYNERYFDLIAREFDVVIFDEADNAQQSLDMSGISQLKLSGYKSSFHEQVQQETLQNIAVGSNGRLRNESFVQFSLECAEFEKLNIHLISAIHRLDEGHRNSLSGLLLTPLRLIGDWLTPKRKNPSSDAAHTQDTKARAKAALAFVWEYAAIRAFQSRREVLDRSTKSMDQWRRSAEALQQPLEKLAEDATALQSYLAIWLNAATNRDRTEHEEAIEQLLVPYLRITDPGSIKMLVRLLITVTFTVLSYRRMVARLHELEKDSVIRAVRVDERCSEDLLIGCPDNLLGSLSGVRFFTEVRANAAHDRDHDVQLQYIVFSGAPRAFMYHLHEWVTRPDGSLGGPAVLLTSATSYMPDSPAFHVDVEPSYLLHRPARTSASVKQKSIYAFRPIIDRDSVDGEPLRYSGVRSERARLNNLQKMAAFLLEGGSSSKVAEDCRDFDIKEGIGRKAAFVVNSYAHCLAIKQFIDQRFASWRDRTIAVVDQIPPGALGGYVTPSMVEALGDNPNWDLLIFPMGALGRGTNVVYSGGPRQRDATIGTLYFLTRPHPSPDDLGFLVSLGARATMDFDQRDLGLFDRLDEFTQELRYARGRLYKLVGHLLRHPLYARSLGPDLFTPFTANVAVPLLQTIGRGMRNGCPVQCFFVDRAWAEKSSIGEQDDESSSMLVQLRKIIERGVQSKDKRVALLFEELYGPFLEPLLEVKGLNSMDRKPSEEDDYVEASPLWAADSPVEGEE